MSDLIQLNLVARGLQQDIVNRFYYWALDKIVEDELVNFFIATVLSAVQGIVSDNTTFEAIELTRPRDDVAVSARYKLTGFTGVRAGTPMPSYATIGYIMNRSTSAVRSGGKRFGLVTESDFNGNNAEGFFENNLENVESPLGSNYDGANGIVFPVLYRPPFTTEDGVGRIVPVASGSYARTSSQKTRQLGRGSDGPRQGGFVSNINQNNFIPNPALVVSRWSDYIASGNQPFYVDIENGQETIVYL